VNAAARLAGWPRTRLANLPTPLLRADRLARGLGLPGPLYLKMDSETGFGLGGNKVRKLEFELAPHRLDGVTCLITAGGPQSNHARVTAAFAARYGLDCVLVLTGPAPERPTGNALLHRLFGADIVTVPSREDRESAMVEAADRVSAAGGKPLVIPIGASTPLGSLGYAAAALELSEQLADLDDGCEETTVLSSSSSCGTLAGLLLGCALRTDLPVNLVGVSADATAAELRRDTEALARGADALIGAEADLSVVPLETDDAEVGDGYGIPTKASSAATERFGRLAGVVLDPTYTAKAAAGLIRRIDAGVFDPGHRVVFLHTGGHPGLLA
jgi:1-aminocyclopropane-1-carboxylate deaminase/D-cysteine desulfhydrase-like pyridoxal-dependent ACC family enzyme